MLSRGSAEAGLRRWEARPLRLVIKSMEKVGLAPQRGGRIAPRRQHRRSAGAELVSPGLPRFPTPPLKSLSAPLSLGWLDGRDLKRPKSG